MTIYCAVENASSRSKMGDDSETEVIGSCVRATEALRKELRGKWVNGGKLYVAYILMPPSLLLV